MSNKDEKLEKFMRKLLKNELDYLGSINVDECDTTELMEVMVSAHNVMETAKFIRGKLMN